MKKLLLLLLLLPLFFQSEAQNINCTFKEPQILINFGSGYVPDLNTEDPSDYRRVPRYCPTDGHYTYAAYTSDCFRGDWITLLEDHTPGDADGNMMLVNAAPSSGAFLRTTIIGLKSNTMYEISLWMLNLCRPTEKCPFPLLPNITILLQTAAGKTVSYLSTGELIRMEAPQWKQYSTIFTAPASETSLTLTMIDNAPGGCGNDFALDDIAFRECIITKPPPVVTTKKTPEKTTAKTTKPATPPKIIAVTNPPKPPVTKPPVVALQQPAKQQPPPPVIAKQQPPPVVKQPAPPPANPPVAKQTPPPPVTTAVVKQQPPPITPPVVKQQPPPVKPPVVAKQQPPPVKPPVVAKKTAPPKTVPPKTTEQPKTEPPISLANTPPATIRLDTPAVSKPRTPALPPPPPVLVTRSNQLIKQLDIEPGEIQVALYDNGTIDDDTVSIYHNNVLMISRARLSQKPISFNIPIDAAHPHHELVMVANNLGSIPPNTSLMIINAGAKRYEVFISSTEQKNAKVIIDLKE